MRRQLLTTVASGALLPTTPERRKFKEANYSLRCCRIVHTCRPSFPNATTVPLPLQCLYRRLPNIQNKANNLTNPQPSSRYYACSQIFFHRCTCESCTTREASYDATSPCLRHRNQTSNSITKPRYFFQTAPISPFGAQKGMLEESCAPPPAVATQCEVRYFQAPGYRLSPFVISQRISALVISRRPDGTPVLQILFVHLLYLVPRKLACISAPRPRPSYLPQLDPVFNSPSLIRGHDVPRISLISSLRPPMSSSFIYTRYPIISKTCSLEAPFHATTVHFTASQLFINTSSNVAYAPARCKLPSLLDVHPFSPCQKHLFYYFIGIHPEKLCNIQNCFHLRVARLLARSMSRRPVLQASDTMSILNRHCTHITPRQSDIPYSQTQILHVWFHTINTFFKSFSGPPPGIYHV